VAKQNLIGLASTWICSETTAKKIRET